MYTYTERQLGRGGAFKYPLPLCRIFWGESALGLLLAFAIFSILETISGKKASERNLVVDVTSFTSYIGSMLIPRGGTGGEAEPPS